MDEHEFDRLVGICRLRLSGEEREAIKKDINEIIKYFDAIEKVDTKNASEAYHPIHIDEKLRDDVIVPFDNTEGLLNNTRTYRFYVVGPKV
jgi:aspartyl-tRNA(Asn)/glutamyl-tRNA(Gln) amidotransferase subunit C